MCHRKCFSTRDMGCSSARSRSQDTIEAQSQSFPSALKSRARLTTASAIRSLETAHRNIVARRAEDEWVRFAVRLMNLIQLCVQVGETSKVAR